MTTNSDARGSKDEQETIYPFSERLVIFITLMVCAGITGILAGLITVIVTVVVLLGGLWLAYTYLPLNVFYIIIAVLIADITLGVVLRIFRPRK